MKIWIIDHYSVPVKYYPLARNTNFARQLIKRGHEVIIFAASTVHNSVKNLTEQGKKYIEVKDGEVRYVLVKCRQYSGNGLKRILNMYEFSQKLDAVCEKYPKPDAILSTSMTLFACKKGIQLGQKYGCRKIAQITDLWPETIVAYGRATKSHPVVLYFRRIEKWIYQHADRIVFSMEGAYDYIEEQGWTKEVPREKVYHINNGVDLGQFDKNREQFRIEDDDLLNPDLFKVVYTGSIRKVNNLGLILDVAKLVKKENVVFLIWGGGDELEDLKARVEAEHIGNVRLKGTIGKQYIPYIAGKADVNFLHNSPSPVFQYGLSMNKAFDYLAAGKPILTDLVSPWNPAVQCGAAVEIKKPAAENIAKAVDRMADMASEELSRLGANAREGAKKYDFKKLAEQLEAVIRNIQEN